MTSFRTQTKYAIWLIENQFAIHSNRGEETSFESLEEMKWPAVTAVLLVAVYANDGLGKFLFDVKSFLRMKMRERSSKNFGCRIRTTYKSFFTHDCRFLHA